MNPHEHPHFSELPSRVRDLLRPALRLSARHPPVDEPLAPGGSRIGGEPDLPEHFEWPKYLGTPMSFIAQLDLEELSKWPQVLPLPEDGSLVFFYDSTQRTWGYDPEDRPSFQVAHLTGPRDRWMRRPVPGDMPDGGAFALCHLEYQPITTLPPAASPLFDPELSGDERDLLDRIFEHTTEADEGMRHQLGGHPYLVQNPMELKCQLVSNGVYCGDSSEHESPRALALAKGVRDWRLLLQIDSEDPAGMMWGDVGCIYFWIRENDLRDRDFDQAWLVLQCC